MPEIEHVMVELLPGNASRQSVYILNVYSSPSHHKQRLKRLFQKAIRLAGSNPIVIAGDFNAAHRTWGYAYDTPKGTELWQNANDMNLTLITDKAFPTRTGTSMQRDSTPDLCFVKNVADAQRPPPCATPSLETWTDQLKVDVGKATKTIRTNLPTERMDSRLAHLLEAKQSLLARWKGQRLNRRLRKRISELNKSIADHCSTLFKQQWDEILHQAKGTAPPKDVAKSLVQKYLPLPADPSIPHPEYTGTDNTHLDADFSVEEVRRALHELNGRSTPGPDGIPNKLLRNLDEPSVNYLTDTINETWKKGELPNAWKLAHTILIPKPGKAPSLDHLRPISLTSDPMKCCSDPGGLRTPEGLLD
ncbi:uncharacterized protein LOC119444253 [Dermacentor silvarum]|uniref:uncharacterized protein LOC119444253 n=1 Tax=Dermacentor silvarum TaxID=543639 RepID=UPI00189875CE|nr:uncharacterized protein LOC119444253 [Dermacentor silvarum]